MFKVRRMNDRV